MTILESESQSQPRRHRAERHDRRGNATTGPSEAVDTYDVALDRLLRFHPEVVDLSAALVEEHPAFPMGQALAAYLYLMGTDVPDLPVARNAHRALVAAGGNEREMMHAAAIGAWLDGDWVGAAGALDSLLLHWPADLLALALGHQLDFFLGDAQNLRDRPIRSLGELEAGGADAAFVLGMHAFGLEETGHYDRAEAAALEAVTVNPDDVWGIHAGVHTYEMQGRVGDGLGFMRPRLGDWGTGNLFTVHLWWHYALFHLEAGATAETLAIYDRHIHNAESVGVPLEMLDASALLWRLLLDDVDTGHRFAALADAWATRLENEPWYVFNDVHACMAFVGAGRLGDARAVVAKLTSQVSGGVADGTNRAMTAEVGLPVCRAVIAFVEGRYADAVGALAPIRHSLHRFGGSHAQRDAWQRTLLEAALRGGDLALARALLAERLSLRETSVYGWTRQARLLAAQGRTADAAAAAGNAAAHRRRFAAALA